MLRAQPLRTALSNIKAITSNSSADPPQLPSLPTVTETADDRKREDRRIAKWGRMLVPAVRDSGANISKWKIEERKMRKLEERVFKGIPDRWRAAAWYSLMDQRATDGAVRLSVSKEDRQVMRAEKLAIKYRVRLLLCV